MRFKVLEERLTSPSGNSRTLELKGINNGPSRRQSLGGLDSLSRLSSNGYLSRKSSAVSGSTRSNSATSLLRHAKYSSRSYDGGSRSLDRGRVDLDVTEKDNVTASVDDGNKCDKTASACEENGNGTPVEKTKTELEDCVSGALYDMLQKEVVNLRKACHEKDQILKDKDDAIQVR